MATYSSQILTGSKDEQKWALPTNKGKTPAILQPGQMLFKNGNYYWLDNDGKVQKTADVQTAYGTLSKNTNWSAGDASQVVQAANQKFNLGGGAIQYDPKSKSYYFKDPSTGKLLTTSNLATAYNTLYPSQTTSTTTTTGENITYDPTKTSTLQNTANQVSLTPDASGNLQAVTGTPESGFRPTATSPQFYQPVYQTQYQNYTKPGYSLMGDQSGIGALSAVQGQNTAGNAALDLSRLGPQQLDMSKLGPQQLDMSRLRPQGIGQTANPFSINPNNYRQQYQSAMSYAQPNYGQFSGMNYQPAPVYSQQSYAQPMQSYGTMGGIGSLQTPFGSAGSQGAFGGGFGGTSLYNKGK